MLGCRVGRQLVASAASCSSAAVKAHSPQAIRITDAAVARLQKVAGAERRLRVTVDGGGCSGFEYKFSLEEKTAEGQPDDRTFSRDGVTVVVDELSLDYMRGADVDYTTELIRSAFKVANNPLAEKGCSCGSSFALKMD